MADESELKAHIEQLKAELATAHAEQWKLIRSVCHELRLPLSAIKGYNDLMPLMGTISDQQKDFVVRIKKNVARMSGMIANLHDLAFMGEGTFRLKPISIPVAAALQKACREAQEVAAESHTTLTCQVPDGLPPVQADLERLAQCLRILIENACSYTPAGGQVTVSASQASDGRIKIEVSDTGIGVPEDERAALFTLFFRGDSQVVREQTGAGMNLYMLRRFVELMDGTCGAGFPAEGGSRFWICLPAAS